MIGEVEQKVYDLLRDLTIPFERFEHPPVYTVEEARSYWGDISGSHCKNLFLRNARGNRHFLVVLEESKRVDLKELSSRLETGKLSFASERRLREHLGLESGAVSPFGLINDQNGAVTLVLDGDLCREEYICFHPNVNTATIRISYADFERFTEHCGVKVIAL